MISTYTCECLIYFVLYKILHYVCTYIYHTSVYDTYICKYDIRSYTELSAETLRRRDVAAAGSNPGGGGDDPEVRFRQGQPSEGGRRGARDAGTPGAVSQKIRPNEMLPSQGCEVCACACKYELVQVYGLCMCVQKY